jgi:chemotaxis protein methyltransferase CheR
MQETRPDDNAPDRLLTLLSDRMGLELIGTRRESALAAIRSAMAESDIVSLDEYYARITSEEKDLDRLIDAVSIGETYFFREPAQFEFLREQIISDARRARGFDTPINIWSAGCASGEEAYSIAILLEETGVSTSSRILGTDISKAAISQARLANYRAWSLRTADSTFLDRYFALDGLHYKLCDRIRKRATFEHHNLSAPGLPPSVLGGDMDVIFLRNVLIYFGREMSKSLVARLSSALRPGGWLITASCDPPVQGVPELEAISSDGCVFYRRRSTATGFVPSPRTSPLDEEPKRIVPAKAPAKTSATSAKADSAQETETFDRQAAHLALRTGDYVEVLRLTDRCRNESEASALAARATANLAGSLAAYRECERACRNHPLSADLHYLRGVFLFDLGRCTDAADAFRRVVYLDPSSALAHFSLGTLLEKLGDTSRALRAFQNAQALCSQMDPDQVVPLTDDETAANLATAVLGRIDRLDDASNTRGRGAS